MSYIQIDINSIKPNGQILIVIWKGDIGNGFFINQEVIYQGRTRLSNIKKARHRVRQISAGYKALDKKIVIKNYENL